MNDIVNILLIPLLIGILLFVLPERIRTIKGILSLITCLITLYFIVVLLFMDTTDKSVTNNSFLYSFSIAQIDLGSVANKYIIFKIDNLTRLIIILIGLFVLLINFYSIIYIKGSDKFKDYYAYYQLTFGASLGAVLADNLLLFLFFWGILGITLYKLIPGHDNKSSDTAKKTLIIVGASDCIMILGIALLWKITGTLNMSEISIPSDNILAITAFLALLVGSFTKAGAFPFHTWVPDYAESAPASSSALMPASLDKLLGIYFLYRITTQLFVMNEWLRLILLSIGVITIITAVMMALVQHNYKKLLGFHAVSQVGYMIVGFGLGSAIGIAAGLFHMVNNALYKGGLFLSSGSIEYRTGKNEIDDVGGLSRVMPMSFITALIFALSISGIPPFNGFASKWMIYQGIIEFGEGKGIAHQLWILWLGLAILGSALTLASFIKFIGGIFLGRQREEYKNIKEVPALMWIPLAVLALICIAFGVFATGYVVPKIFMPIYESFEFAGTWHSSVVSMLILISIILGIIIYLMGNIKKFRTADSFIGGEKFNDKVGFSTTEFYKSINEFRFFSYVYSKAEEKWFDIYDLSKRFTLGLSKALSTTHSGILTDYSIWVFIGLIIMLIIMI